MISEQCLYGSEPVLAPPKWWWDSIDTNIKEASVALVVRGLDLLVKTEIWSLHHQICTSAIGMGVKWIALSIRRCKDHIGGHPPSVSMYRVNPYFRIVLLITQNQSLHLHIDDRIRLIPISMEPVQFWQCEDWNFVYENKNPLTAPPDLHRCHWYGYQMNLNLN